MSGINRSSGFTPVGPSGQRKSGSVKSENLQKFESLVDQAITDGNEKDLSEFCDAFEHAILNGNHSVDEAFQLRLQMLKISVARVRHAHIPVDPCIQSLLAFEEDIKGSNMLSPTERDDYLTEINELKAIFTVLKNPQTFLDEHPDEPENPFGQPSTHGIDITPIA